MGTPWGCRQQFTLRNLGRLRGLRMQPLKNRGVPIPERNSASQFGSRTDWESIHTFLEVARHGSFRSASDQLGLSINSLRRQINELERQLGVTLLTRHVDGVRLTPEGEE